MFRECVKVSHVIAECKVINHHPFYDQTDDFILFVT